MTPEEMFARLHPEIEATKDCENMCRGELLEVIYILRAEIESMKNEYDEQRRYGELQFESASNAISELVKLRAKLDVAIEALRNIVADYRDSYSIAFDALRELEAE